MKKARSVRAFFKKRRSDQKTPKSMRIRITLMGTPKSQAMIGIRISFE